MIFKLRTPAFVLTCWTSCAILLPQSLLAAGEPCPPEGAAPPSNAASIETLKSAIDPGRTSWVDGVFMLEYVKAQKDSDYKVQGTHLNTLPEIVKSNANRLYQGAFGEVLVNGAPKPTTFKQQLHWLREQGASLNTNEKLLVLSLFGSRLSQGYDANIKNIMSDEAVFQNALKHGKNGGICGDIHNYLTQVALALGFQDARVHSGLWQKNPKKPDQDGHFIMVFKDPKTGEYYSQNYSQLVRTGEKNLEAALNSSLRTLGPFSGSIFVGPAENSSRFRTFVPQTTRWLDREFRDASSFKPGASTFNFTMGNHTERFSMQAEGTTAGGTQIKAFALHTAYNGTERYRVDAVGVATQNEYVAQGLKYVDEIGLKSTARVGIMNFEMPMSKANSDGSLTHTSASSNGIFLGTDIKGRARVNNTTGRLELDVSEDIAKKGVASAPRARILTGVDQKLGKDSPVTVSVERATGLTTRDYHSIIQPALRTDYDKVSVVYDSRNPEKPEAYLVAGGELYLFDGIQKSTAKGLRTFLKQAVPTERLGEFSVLADLSKITASKDTYFDQPLVKTLGVDWTKKTDIAGARGDVGVAMRYQNRTPSQVFDLRNSPVIDTLTPEFHTKKVVTGTIWYHMSF